MRMDLKAKQARKRKRSLDLRHRNTTLVDIEQMLVETLDTHLNLGATQAADEREAQKIMFDLLFQDQRDEYKKLTLGELADLFEEWNDKSSMALGEF